MITGQHGSSSASNAVSSASELTHVQFSLLFSAGLFLFFGLFLQKFVLAEFNHELKSNLSSWSWFFKLKVGVDEIDLQSLPPPPIVRRVKVLDKPRVMSKVAAMSGPKKIPEIRPLNTEENKTERNSLEENAKLAKVHQFLTAKFLIAVSAPLVPTVPVYYAQAAVTKPIVEPAYQEEPSLQKNSAGSASPSPIQIAVEKAQEWNEKIPQKFHRVSAQVEKAQAKVQSKLRQSPQTTVAERRSQESLKQQSQEVQELAFVTSHQGLENTLKSHVENGAIQVRDLPVDSHLDLGVLNTQIASLSGGAYSETMSSHPGVTTHGGMTTQTGVAPSIATGMTAPQPGVTSHQELTIQNDYPQPSRSSAHPDSAITPPHLEVASVSEASQSQDQEVPGVPGVEDALVQANNQPTFVEAFDIRQNPIEYAETQIISSEEVPGTALGQKLSWMRVRSESHLPSFALFTGQPIPLVSWNTARSLALKAGVNLHAEAGMLFGQVNSEWEVEIQYNSKDGQPVSVSPSVVYEAEPGLKYFAFLNIHPTNYHVFFSSFKRGQSGSVAVPVLGGTGTYVDLRQIRTQSISGKVVKASFFEDRLLPLKKTTVRVVGQAVAAMTHSTGRFSLDHVLTVGNYPIYLETDRATHREIGYTHRSSVYPSEIATNPSGVTLYRIPNREIDDYLSQLEGGVSPESGVVIAALSGLIQESPQGLFQPAVKSISSSLNLIPETYTVDPDGRLWPARNKTLTEHETRVIGVQVPSGAFVTEVTDPVNHNVVVSELGFIDSRIVYVARPR